MLNITGRVLLASGRSEYDKLLESNNEVGHKRLCQMFYNPKYSEYVDGLAFRFLEQGELRKLLRRATNSEIFYRPIDRRAARNMVGGEAEVSQAICDADALETEERERLKRVKRLVLKRVEKESSKFVSQAERLSERMSQLESSCEQYTFTGGQEILLNEIRARDDQIQSQGILISSLNERITALESSDLSKKSNQEASSRRLDRRMERNEEVRRSVGKKRAKRRRNRANRAKKQIPAASEAPPTETLLNSDKAQT